MNLATIIQRCLRRYGLDGAGDAFFTSTVMTELANEKHRWLAEEARCYRQTITKDLPATGASTGLSTVYTGCNVIVSLPYTIRVYVGGDWKPLTMASEEELAAIYGPIRTATNGDPSYFFFRVGTAKDEQRVVECFPGVASAVTGGFQIDAYVYPAAMSSDSHAPAMQPAETDALIPAVLWGMAEMELNRATRTDAFGLVAYWEKQARKAAQELRNVTTEAKGPAEIRFNPATDWMGW